MAACRIRRHHSNRENPLEADVQGADGAQRERLAQVNLRLFFFAELSSVDISGRFYMAPAITTMDLERYRALSPDNICFHGRKKTCYVTDDFRSMFEHSLDRAMTALFRSLGDWLGEAENGLLPSEYCLRQRGRVALDGVSASIAPGYLPEGGGRG